MRGFSFFCEDVGGGSVGVGRGGDATSVGVGGARVGVGAVDADRVLQEPGRLGIPLRALPRPDARY